MWLYVTEERTRRPTGCSRTSSPRCSTGRTRICASSLCRSGRPSSAPRAAARLRGGRRGGVFVWPLARRPSPARGLFRETRLRPRRDGVGCPHHGRWTRESLRFAVRVLGGFAVAVGDRAVPESALAPAQGQERDQAAGAGARAAHSPRARGRAAVARPQRRLRRQQPPPGALRRRAAPWRPPAPTRWSAWRFATTCWCSPRNAPVEIDAVQFEQAAEAARAAGTVEAYRDAARALRRRAAARGPLRGLGRRPSRGAARAAPRAAARARRAALPARATPRARSRRSSARSSTTRCTRRPTAGSCGCSPRSGRRQQALAQYQQLRQTLRREYEADPDPETRRLYQEILAGQLDLPAPRSAGRRAGRRARRAGPPRRGTTCRCSSPASSGASASWPRCASCSAAARLLTLTGPGGARQDAARAGGRRARELHDYPDGVWLVELAPLADPASSRRRPPRRSACSCARQRRRRRGAGPADRRPAAAAAARQLRAPDRRLRAAGRGAAARAAPACASSPPAASRCASAGEVTWRVPSLALPDPGAASRAAELTALRGRAPVRRARGRRRPGLRADRRERRRGGRDLPPPRRHAARARAGRRARRRAVARRRSPRAWTTARLLARRPRRLAAPADPARRRSTGATTCSPSEERRALPPPGRLRRAFGLEAVEGVCAGDGLRRRRTLDAARAPGGQVARRRRGGARREPLPAAGDDPPVRARAPGRGRRDRGARGRAPRAGTSPWREPPTRTWPGERFFESRGARARQPARGAGLRAARRPVAPPCAPAVALWPLWMRRGYFTEGARLLDAALAAEPRAHAAARARAVVRRFGARRAPGAIRAHRPARSTRRAEMHATLGDRRALAGALPLPRRARVGARPGTPPPAETLRGGLRRRPSASARRSWPRAPSRPGRGGVLARARRRGPAAHAGGPATCCRPPRDPTPRCWATTIGLVVDRDAHGRVAHVLRGHAAPVPRGSARRGRAALHPVRPTRWWPAPRATTTPRARGARPRPRAAPRARRPRGTGVDAQRPGQPRPLTRGVRARAASGSRRRSRIRREMGDRRAIADDPRLPGPARRARAGDRAEGRGLIGRGAGHLRRDRGRARALGNAPQPRQPRARGGRGRARGDVPGGGRRAVRRR